MGLKIAIAWVPTFLVVIALIFVVLTPIDERRHRIIRRRLNARLARATLNKAAETVPPTLGIIKPIKSVQLQEPMNE